MFIVFVYHASSAGMMIPNVAFVCAAISSRTPSHGRDRQRADLFFRPPGDERR
jgi:hypothetical protein